jgi:hypothetical protein
MSMPDLNMQQKLQSLANELRAAADFYFSLSEASKREQVVTALRESLGHFTKRAKESLPQSVKTDENGGCPPGWKPCRDGSCVPPGEDCPPMPPE